MDAVGVFSFARYSPGGGFALMWPLTRAAEEPEAAASLAEAELRKLARRSSKVMAHEIGLAVRTSMSGWGEGRGGARE